MKADPFAQFRMVAAIYARISTQGQEEGTSLDTQVEFCMSSALEDGWPVPPELILREVWSGADIQRTQLHVLRNLARSGKLGALYVLSTDRLSRDAVDLLMLVKEFEDNGVQVKFIQGVSDSSPEGRLLMFVDGYVSQKERARTAERTMRGKWAVAQSGRLPNGTGAGLYGYNYNKDLKLREINDVEAAVVLLMFQWALGESPSTKLPSGSTSWAFAPRREPCGTQ